MEKNKKIILLPLLLLLALSAPLFCGCQNQSKIEVSDFTDVAAKTYDSAGKLSVPENYAAFAIYGKDKTVILDAVLIKYKDNMSVADVSREVCRAKKIPIAFSGAGNMVYVQGINNLFERDNGAESGWVYSVNGVFQSVGCGDCTVKSGDFIEWFYTLDLGKDVGASAAETTAK